MPSPLGANGFAFGFNKERFDRWTKIKNDTNTDIKKHWARLDPEFKYAVTQDPQYVPADLVGSLTAAWNGKVYCGSKPYVFESNNSTDLRVNYQLSYTVLSDIKTITDLMKTGNKLKLDKDYFIVSVIPSVVASGTTTGGFYYLADPTKDFQALKVKVGDLVVKVSTGEAFPVENVKVTQLECQCERAFNNGDKYEVRRLVVRLSNTVGGAPLTFATIGNLNFQPSDKVFYYPAGCNATAGNDDIADNFGQNMVRYLIYYNLLTMNQKLMVNDVAVTLINILMKSGKAVTLDDYDNWHDAWTATTMFCLAIKTEFPALYTQITSEPKYTEWFKGITHYFKDVIGGTAPDTISIPVQGTNYDPSTLREIIKKIIWIEEFEGHVYFPDMHAKLKTIGEGLKAYFCYTMTDTFQYSDTQRIHDSYDYLSYDNFATLGDLNKDPDLFLMWDKLNTIAAIKFDSQNANHSVFDDPYAPRSTDWITKKDLHYNDSIRGVSFYHTGRDITKDSEFYCNMWGNTGADHCIDGTDVNLYRKGQWMLDCARSYPGADRGYFQSLNCLIPFGAYAIKNFNVQRDYQHGTNWFYAKGTKHNDNNLSRDSMSNGAGNVIEQTRQAAGYRCANGADLIFVWDTLETPASYQPSDAETTQRATLSRFRHNFNWCVPEDGSVTKVGDSWTWQGNLVGPDAKYIPGPDKITLTTFVNNYSFGIYGMEVIGKPDVYPCITIAPIAKSLGRCIVKFLRIVPENEQYGRFTWGHALYARSQGDTDVIYTKTANSIIAQVGTEKVEAVFVPSFQLLVNSAPIPVPTPTPTPIPTPTPDPTPVPIPTPTPIPSPTSSTTAIKLIVPYNGKNIQIEISNVKITDL